MKYLLIHSRYGLYKVAVKDAVEVLVEDMKRSWMLHYMTTFDLDYSEARKLAYRDAHDLEPNLTQLLQYAELFEPALQARAALIRGQPGPSGKCAPGEVERVILASENDLDRILRTAPLDLYCRPEPYRKIASSSGEAAGKP